MKTAIELAEEFPEQNLANIEPDAVNHLNLWGLEAVAMLLQQAEQIEALTKERDGAYVQSLQFSAENEALKADAGRYRKIKPSFVWDNENSHGHWVCYITSAMWGPDVEPDAAIDAMKGKS